MPGRSCQGSCATWPGELHKQIELEMHGADTELDRQVLDLIQGSLDPHGAQTRPITGWRRRPMRAAAGKPEQGTIRPFSLS